MALRFLVKCQKLCHNHYLKNSSYSEIMFLSNIRQISNTPQQNQITCSLVKPKVQNKNKINLPRNMVFKPNSLSHSTVGRPLTLIFAWMLAEDKHIEKYRQLWLNRGYDVLTVTTSPFDLLFPTIGAQITAKKLVNILSDLNTKYDGILIHAFSVGGYQFGETLLRMKAQDEELMLMKSIKGVIMDSMVHSQDCAPGLSRAVTTHRIYQPILEKSVKMFVKLFEKQTMRHYVKAEEIMANPIVRYPALMLYSKDDVVSNVESHVRAVQNWEKLGNDIKTKCWDHSTHVLHYRHHKSEYEQELDAFLQSLKLRNSQS